MEPSMNRALTFGGLFFLIAAPAFVALHCVPTPPTPPDHTPAVSSSVDLTNQYCEAHKMICYRECVRVTGHYIAYSYGRATVTAGGSAGAAAPAGSTPRCSKAGRMDSRMARLPALVWSHCEVESDSEWSGLKGT